MAAAGLPCAWSRATIGASSSAASPRISRGRDGQYAMRGAAAALTRTSSLAQPFDNDYRLGAITVRKRWRGVELVVATGIVQHELETRFDATGFPGTTGPQLFVEDIGITLISNETRLSQPNARGEGWVGGLSFVHDIGEVTRAAWARQRARAAVAPVATRSPRRPLFGQYSLPLTSLGCWLRSAAGSPTTARAAACSMSRPTSDEPERRKPAPLAKRGDDLAARAATRWPTSASSRPTAPAASPSPTARRPFRPQVRNGLARLPWRLAFALVSCPATGSHSPPRCPMRAGRTSRPT